MDRKEFSSFLNQRRKIMRRLWKQLASDGNVEPITLARLRRDGPEETKADETTKAGIAKAMKFKSWDDLVRAWRRGKPGAGLGINDETPIPERISPPRAAVVATELDFLARPSSEDRREEVFRQLNVDTLAALAARICDHVSQRSRPKL